MTLLDGLVARSAFNHSVNYRSVVVHATAAVVQDPQEKTAALGCAGRSGGTGQDRWYSAAFTKRAGGHDRSSAGPPRGVGQGPHRTARR